MRRMMRAILVCMARYVLTGAPGVGKTTLLNALRVRGYSVVAEAATDVIAAGQARGIETPWESPDFVRAIADLQRARQLGASADGVQFFDRSPICTLALARYASEPVPPVLSDELERIALEDVYERTVFLVRPLGFVERTAARRITYAQSLTFERLHIETYAELGYRLVDLPPAPVDERVAMIEKSISEGHSASTVPGD